VSAGGVLRAVAVVGSPRLNGNTVRVVDEVLAELGRRAVECDKIMLGEQRIAPCRGHVTCKGLDACLLDDDAAAVLDRVYRADCLILASPVYYEDVSAQMKTFIDRNAYYFYRDAWLRARAVGLIAVTKVTGIEETLATMRRYVTLSTTGEVPVFTLGGYAGDPGDAAAQPELLAAARGLAADLAGALGLSAAAIPGSQ